MPFPRCYTNETLEAVALEATRIFSLDSSVKILFVEVIPNFRECWGLYYIPTKIIYIRKRGSLLKMIETLMHEIVHAKQHKLGIIGLATNGKESPKGESCGEATGLAFKNKTVFKGDWTYETMPWEIQANKYMGPMFDTFCRKANLKVLQSVREAEVRFQHQIA
jgi:hypothetical protein